MVFLVPALGNGVSLTDTASKPKHKNLELPLLKNAPPAFHLLAKPTGAICNLDCAYCFFLDKEVLYPDSDFRMSEDLLETYLQQLIESHQTDQVTIAWQGGEPTLMGLDFYRKAVTLAEKYRRPGMTLEHTMQTNGTLLNDDWCAFFKDNNFLIGISIDGPRHLHDIYRVDKGGGPTFDRVMRGLRLLQKHGVAFNILTAVNRVNADHPLEAYRFLRDEAEADWIQFIPVVERINADGRTLYQEGSTVSERSVLPDQLGRFLNLIFDEWVNHDVGSVFVQTFEAALRNWMGLPSSGMCVFNETCGLGVALEHNGDLYACDHFVEPDYFLGNIQLNHMIELVASPQQRQFGLEKRSKLPQYCLDCDVRFACHGECPKNRFIETPAGDPHLNYLCSGFKSFFHHINFPMKIMAGLIHRGYHAEQVMDILAREKANWTAIFKQTGRNAPCPCGSGKKFKSCHGQKSSNGNYRIPQKPAPTG